jgi:hypothetical protein
MMFAVVFNPDADKNATVAVLVPLRVNPPSVSVCEPVAMLVFAKRFNAPELSVTVPNVSAYVLPVVFAYVRVPPFEVIPAALFTRFNAPSAEDVFVSVKLPSFNVIPDVLTNAWFDAANASVCPTPIVVAPLHPVVDVPFNVNVFATNPAANPPESVTLPVPATAPVIVTPTVVVAFACANVFNVKALLAPPKVSVFAPKFKA